MALALTADCTAYSALLVTSAAIVIGYWVIVRSVTTQPGTPAVTIPHGVYYLTEALGRTRHLTRAQRLHHWRQAASYITRIIRIRIRWANTGKLLQTPRIRDLVSGVVRHRGLLRRERAAAVL
jgi:hypothetical protein